MFSSLYTGISTDSVTVAGSSGVNARGMAASVKVRGAEEGIVRSSRETGGIVRCSGETVVIVRSR